MRTVTSHSTQTKKSYRKPVLNRFGNVAKLTKGKTGGSLDELTNELNFTE